MLILNTLIKLKPNLVIYTRDGGTVQGQGQRKGITGRMLNIRFAIEQRAMQAALPASLPM